MMLLPLWPVAVVGAESGHSLSGTWCILLRETNLGSEWTTTPRRLPPWIRTGDLQLLMECPQPLSAANAALATGWLSQRTKCCHGSSVPCSLSRYRL